MRVAAAQLNGIAERVWVGRRATPEEGLAEMAEVLGRLRTAADRQRALDLAVVPYVEPEYEAHAGVRDLLVRAGADLDAAAAIRAQRRGGGLSGLGQQAARLPSAQHQQDQAGQQPERRGDGGQGELPAQ